MKKMSNIAKNLNILAKTGRIICLIFGGLLAVAAVVLAFVDSSVFSKLSTTITLGNIGFELAPEYQPESVYLKIRFIMALAVVAIWVIFIAVAMKYAGKVLTPFAEQKPFDEAVPANLKKLGFFSLVFGVVYPLAQMGAQAYLLYVYDFRSIFIGDSILSIEADFDFDLTYIIIAGVLFMLSYIFKYGAELQNQSDETL